MTKPWKIFSTVLSTVLFLQILVLWSNLANGPVGRFIVGQAVTFHESGGPIWFAWPIYWSAWCMWWAIPIAAFVLAITKVWKR